MTDCPHCHKPVYRPTADREQASCFPSWNDAREWADRHVRGWPAWRVFDTGVGPIIELIPGGPYVKRL